MKYLFCFTCYLYTLLTIIEATNTTRVHVISSTCKMYNGDSDCSKYDLQICHTRNICSPTMPFNPRGCFDYVTYTDLKADKDSMQHFQPPNEKIRDMGGFFIVVVNRGTYGYSSADFVATSCENNRTGTTNGINIKTTSVQNGMTFDFELNIEMDCAISSCYGQECEICVTTEKTTAYTSSNDQTTHYTQIVETGNSVLTQQVKTSSILPTQGIKTSTSLPTQGVKTSIILPTQGIKTSIILPTQGIKTSTSLPTQGIKTSIILPTQGIKTSTSLPTEGVKTSIILSTQGVKTITILSTQGVDIHNKASTPSTTSTVHTENYMTTVRHNGNLTVDGSPPVETSLTTGQVIGIVLGVCGGIILVVIIISIICYHKKTKKTAVEDAPEIHVENNGALKTKGQFERNDEKINLLNGSVTNEYPPGMSTVFGHDSQGPIKDDDIPNSRKEASEIQKTSTEKYDNPECPHIDSERDGKRKKKRKKSKHSKKKDGSKRDKNKSTEFINENERNVSNYTELEIDGRSKIVCHSDEEIDKTIEKQNDNDYKKQIVQPEDNAKPNTETRSVSQIPDCPSFPGVTQISTTGSPVPITLPNLVDTHCTKSLQSLVGEDYTENLLTIPTSNSMTKSTTTKIDIGGTTSNHLDDTTPSQPIENIKDAKSSHKIGKGVSNSERQSVETEMPCLERQIVEARVSSLDKQNIEEVPNLERRNPSAGVSNLEQQNPGTKVTNLELQNVEEIPNLERRNPSAGVSNLEQQNSGTKVTNLERQNVEEGKQKQKPEIFNLERRQNLDSGTLELEQQISLPGESTLDIRQTSVLHGHYATEESDHSRRIKSKKKKKHKRSYHVEKVDISTVHDVGAYETHIIGRVDVKIITSPRKQQYMYDNI